MQQVLLCDYRTGMLSDSSFRYFASMALSLIISAALGCGSSEGGNGSGGMGSGLAGNGAGGSATGGSATGGSATGGSATGGSATGGSATGGSGGGPAGWPDATNTGIPSSACPNGLANATNADIQPPSGATVECVHFVDNLPIIAQGKTNVSFRYCRFQTAIENTFINLQGGPVTIEFSEFSGSVGTWIRTTYNAHGVTVRRCDIAGTANAVEFGTDGVTIEDNYIHDFANVSPGQHADGLQTSGADGFIIRRNAILMNDVWGATSAVFTINGSNAQITDNLFAGAGYTLHVSGDIQVTGNRFSTMFHDKCGLYGPVYPQPLAPSGVWSDNLWEDGPKQGQAIPAP